MSSKRSKGPDTGRGRSRRGPLVVCVIAALVIVGAAVATAIALLGGGSPNEGAQAPDTPSGQEIAAGEQEAQEELDAWIADYLARSDVRETLDASVAGLTEAEAYEAFSARGFDAASVVTTYEADGSYHEERAISASLATRHPVYTLAYASASGEYWAVACYGDCFTAMPLSRNMMEGKVTTTLSEQEAVVSYDSESNTLYRLVPPSDELTVHVVESVSASYLDSLSAEEVSAL